MFLLPEHYDPLVLLLVRPVVCSDLRICDYPWPRSGPELNTIQVCLIGSSVGRR